MKTESKNLRVIVDSGAFSAWRTGKPIVLKDYLRYLETLGADAFGYFNLDVIPGAKGKVMTESDREQAAAESFKNYLTMKKAGFDPIPVFHGGENLSWLGKMLDAGATYIGIGTIKDDSVPKRRAWLDVVFSYVCGKTSFPIAKLHGLGIWSRKLMPYPWYSVDSSGWMVAATTGVVYAPLADGSGFRMSRVSVEHPRPSSVCGEMHSLFDLAEKEIGITKEDMTTSRDARILMNLWAENRTKIPVLPFTRHGLFPGPTRKGKAAVKETDKVIRFFSVSTSEADSVLMNRVGIQDRLVSFALFPRLDVKKFAASGSLKASTEPKPRKRKAIVRVRR